MAIPKELEYVLEHVKRPDIVRKMLDIPEGYEIHNITDSFLQGGPLVVSFIPITNEAVRARNRERLNDTIMEVVESHCRREQAKCST